MNITLACIFPQPAMYYVCLIKICTYGVYTNYKLSGLAHAFAYLSGHRYMHMNFQKVYVV